MSLLFRPLATANRHAVERLCARSVDRDAWLASGDAHFYGAFDPGDLVSFLSGAPVAVTRLLPGIRTLAHLRRLEGTHATVPADAGLDGMLAHSGFSRWSGQMVLQQRDMDTGH